VTTVNPVAKLAAAFLIAVALVVTIDPVSAGVALGLELALFPAVGVPWGRFWRRTALVWIAAPLTALTIVLYGSPSGTVHVRWLFVEISDGSLWGGLATLLRVLAIALPAVVLFATIDLTAFADGLVQVLHLPVRFVLGAFAVLRLAGLFLDDWRMLELARRARGVADHGRLRRLFGAAFALLVLSIRRGSSLATAMEARGFGGPVRRTWARASTFGVREWMLVVVGAAIGAAAIATSLLSGSWNPLG
jgi:energy-coupling factor transport system permease protein